MKKASLGKKITPVRKSVEIKNVPENKAKADEDSSSDQELTTGKAGKRGGSVMSLMLR